MIIRFPTEILRVSRESAWRTCRALRDHCRVPRSRVHSSMSKNAGFSPSRSRHWSRHGDCWSSSEAQLKHLYLLLTTLEHEDDYCGCIAAYCLGENAQT